MSPDDPYSIILPLFQMMNNVCFVGVGEVPTSFPTAFEAFLFIIGILVFILFNAFFVASEFAIIRVRPTQLDTVEEAKPHRVRVAKQVTEQVEAYLSANQLGITLSTLALGFLGEPFVAKLVGPLLHPIPGMKTTFLWGGFGIIPKDVSWLSVTTYAVAIAVFTFLHVVFGELIPKNVAIRKALGTTLWLAGPLDLFYRVFSRAIAFLNWSANGFMKHVMRMEPPSAHAEVHTAEELAVLVAESARGAHVTKTEREILINALELNEIEVKDIMTPRLEVVGFDANASFADSIAVAKQSMHTRFPLFQGNLDHPLGLVHIKDILHLIGQENPQLSEIARDLKPVPTNMPLDELLRYFLEHQYHAALVVDEYGSSVGMVFLDDVLEELVGEIKDEFDAESKEIQQISENEYLVEGNMSLHDFDDHFEEFDLSGEEVSTVGGFVTTQFGRLPAKGEQLELHGWQVTVAKTDGRRVVQVHFRRL